MMAERRTLTDDDVKAIANAVGVHQCRFTPEEAAVIHGLAQALCNGGMTKFHKLLEMGEAFSRATNAGIIAIIGVTITAIAAVVWAGLLTKLGRG